ncbi:MAG TPA: hypothetical protein VFI74_05080 [Candidatus Saccharimonadales bacterium]|nr:hypothetical protein [Candidatus Saccharimonadales bacterium]
MKPTNKPATPTTSLGNGKIFDVARPGHSLASPTSKPAIVGHKPQVQDPMMARDIDDERRLLGGHERVTVAPLSATVEVPASSEPAPTPEPPKPVAEEVSAQSEVPPQEAEEAPRPEVSSPTDTNEITQEPIVQEPPASVEPPEPTIAPPQPQPELQSQPQPASQPAPQPKLEALTDEDETAAPDTMPTAVVSHHHHSAGALKNVLVALLILLIIGAVIFDILLDAGFVVMNIPHTHFFST